MIKVADYTHYSSFITPLLTIHDLRFGIIRGTFHELTLPYYLHRMQNTLLQKTLRTLTPKELKSFGDFILSPYLNTNKKLISYWEEVKKYAPTFEVDEKQKEKIFTQVFGGKKYNDGQYRNLVSDMMHLLLDFIGQEWLKTNEAPMLYMKAEGTSMRKIPELFEKTVRMLREKKHETKEYSPVSMDMDEWVERFSKSLVQLQTRGRQEAGSQANYALLITRVLNSALVKIYNGYINSLRAESEFNVPFNKDGLRLMLKIYESKLFEKHPLVEAYYYSLKLAVDYQEEDYFSLKHILHHSENFVKLERLHVALTLQRFIAKRIMSENVFWQNELFDLYNYVLEHELWLEQKPLTYIAFFNIVSNALSLGKINYAPGLNSPVKDEIIKLCRAHVLFYKNKSADALEMLATIQTENILIKLELRTLQAMIFYELEETEALNALLESFRHLLHYNTTVVSDSIIAPRLTFCKYLAKLNKFRSDPDKKGGEKLLKSLLNEENLPMQQWLAAHVQKLL